MKELSVIQEQKSAEMKNLLMIRDLQQLFMNVPCELTEPSSFIHDLKEEITKKVTAQCGMSSESKPFVVKSKHT